MILWDEELGSQLADCGLYVIRFDNRDVGLSTKFAEAGVPDVMAAMTARMQGKTVPSPYSLDDMADDSIGLLDASGIHTAHICRKMTGLSYDRCFYPQGVARQYVAVVAHGDRRAALASVTAPALIIHGSDDPLVLVEGGKDTAK